MKYEKKTSIMDNNGQEWYKTFKWIPFFSFCLGFYKPG